MASPDVVSPNASLQQTASPAAVEAKEGLEVNETLLQTRLPAALSNASAGNDGQLPQDGPEPQRAEIRRQEFKVWLLEKSRTKRAVSGTSEERRQLRLRQLQERLAAAEQSRQHALEQVRQRAAVLSSRRCTDTLARLNERQELLANKIYEGLRAADSRRQALKEAERERLRSGRQLVYARLALSQERANAELDEQRRRTEAKLQLADEVRSAKLAEASIRAGEKVKKARSSGALSRALAEQEAARRGSALEKRLEEAEQRRQHRVASGRRSRASFAGSSSSTACESHISSSALSPTASNAAAAAALPGTQPVVSLWPATALSAQPTFVFPGGPLAPEASGFSAALSAESSTSDEAGGEGLTEEPSLPGLEVDAAVVVASACKRAAQEACEDEVLLARADELRRRVSSRKLQQFWRAFVRKRRTTVALATAFVETGITGVTITGSEESLNDLPPTAAAAAAPSLLPLRAGSASAPPPIMMVGGLSSGPRVGSCHSAELDAFERFASALRSPTTLKAAQVLLHRLEVRLQARGALSIGAGRLLRRLFPSAPKDKPLERYPARVFLCAYMVLKHPEVVFNKLGEQEARLAAAGKGMLMAFEALLQRVLEPPEASANGTAQDAPWVSPLAQGMNSFRAKLASEAKAAAAAAMAPMADKQVPSSPGAPLYHATIGQHLVHFDEAWMRYLDQFVAWKFEDAASLEGELLRVAVEMERSMRLKCRGNPNSERVKCSSDLQAVVAQVAHDHGLLRERIGNLSGAAGLARLDAALEQARLSLPSESETEMEADAEDISRAAARRHSRSRASSSAASTPTSSARSSTSGNIGPAANLASVRSAHVIGLAIEAAADAPRAAAAPVAPPLTVSAPAAAPKASGMAAGFFNRGSKGVARAPASAAALGTPSQASSPALVHATPVRQAGMVPLWSASGISSSPAAPLLIPSPRVSATGGGVSVGWSPAASLPPSPSSLPPPRPDLPAESFTNVQLVWELVHNSDYQLPAGDAEAAWQRALGTAMEVLSQVDVSGLESMGPEQLVVFLRSRAKVVAEQAFWDNITSRVTAGLQAGNVLPVVIPLLAEIAMELASLVSHPPAAAAVRQELSEDALTACLVDSAEAAVAGPIGQLQLLLNAVQRCAAFLVQWGAPAREEQALLAQRELREELTAALSTWATTAAAASSVAPAPSAAAVTAAPGAGQLSAALTRALRLLSAQLKLLKLDAANGRLTLLARSLHGTDGATSYLRAKFATLYKLPASIGSAHGRRASESSGTGSTGHEADSTGSSARRASEASGHDGASHVVAEVAAALPRSVVWLRASQVSGAVTASYLAAAGVDLEALARQMDGASPPTTSPTRVPLHLRTGIRPQAVSVGAGANPPSAAKQLTPVAPVPLRSWRGAVRAGIVALVAGEAPAVSHLLAETLMWDVERLHAAQNDFQQLLVITASLLLVGQYRGAAAASSAAAAGDGTAVSSTPPAAWTVAEQTAARRRLIVVLADPAMRLPDLVSELAALAGATDVPAESQLRSAFMSIVSPGSPGFRSIASGLAGLLLAQLLLGRPAAPTHGGYAAPTAVARGAAAILRRIGATAVAEDLSALAGRLGAIVAANEAVHSAVYECLFEAISD